jgi:hypothetical protein
MIYVKTARARRWTAADFASQSRGAGASAPNSSPKNLHVLLAAPRFSIVPISVLTCLRGAEADIEKSALHEPSAGA